MAAYDYRCRTCENVFEVRRGISSAVGEVRCPQGHDDVTRVWTAVAVLDRSGPSTRESRTAVPSVSGCCGGGCCA